jgi:diadenosine tetraphosphate (Ap4A) HIT family hydrolase
MTDEECFFCAELASNANAVMDHELFSVRWDLMPLVPGHAEVIPKRHVQYFDDLTDDERSQLGAVVKDAMEVIRRTNFVELYNRLKAGADDRVRPYLEQMSEKALQVSAPPDAFNHGINDGPQAGQSVPHFHYHLIPRWQGDVENPRGGIRRMFGEDDYSNGK